MKRHELKTDPEPFQSMMDGIKNYEIRLNDRDYQVGEYLWLRETRFSAQEMTEGKPLEYTRRQLSRIIREVRSGYGLKDGFVILAT